MVLLTFFAVFFKYARTGIFMRAVADHLAGAPVEPRQAVRVSLVTRETLAAEEDAAP